MEPRINPNLPDWIVDHLTRYLESNGEDGHMWDASLAGGEGLLPTLLLTTVGRKSGEPLTLPLIYGEADGAYVVIASKGGAPAHPAWYLNLEANPGVGVQVKADRFDARARVAQGEERERLWSKMVGIYAPYEKYAELAGDRVIPVVVLERA
jgi:proline iminopeptidase